MLDALCYLKQLKSYNYLLMIFQTWVRHGKYPANQESGVIQREILLGVLNKVMTRTESILQNEGDCVPLKKYILLFFFFSPLYTADAAHSPGTRRGAG